MNNIRSLSHATIQLNNKKSYLKEEPDNKIQIKSTRTECSNYIFTNYKKLYVRLHITFLEENDPSFFAVMGFPR